ncbi:MAG: DUF1211 domain-containing protein [Candidatus Margulisbacteria bacterium]|nr:DUF1211 domain-containing protein [Candidatus Margulisiibacteriota bacterium]MBU1022245.1 DUF1211 domain-containing protein [Candidatus Margulisiibacteriota bacterium]MBU1729316.1 DUF1211 domain-containing protein [Candidatus Margulisiibacteriota bacterium]MBU1955589.1 DUF1211 domain-containing protein [Candidatus Margulisiibacteriota bacterium]
MAESNQMVGLTTQRIVSLTDGVFAIAMTLLVLNLELPSPSDGITVTKLHQLLADQYYYFFDYALSFMLLGLYWIVHHQQFHYIRRTDRHHIWINIFILMFIALIPFSTSLIGEFSFDWVADVFFGGNLFILGGLFYINWDYATRDRRLVDKDLDPDKVALGKRRTLVTPVVALVAMAMAIAHVTYSSWVYLLIPLILSRKWFRQ